MAKQESSPAESPPMAENVEEILLFLDKEKMFLSALARVDKDGKLKTVPADKGHNNEFLRLNGSEEWLESFFSNFLSQVKDPTRFGIIKIQKSNLEDPLVQKAMKDIEQGRITKTVVKFLEKYGVDPQYNPKINHQKTEKMAKQTNNPASVEDQQPPRYRYNEKMVDWDQLKKHGITRELLERNGHLETMLRGYKTDELIPYKQDMNSAEFKGLGRFYFRQENDGRVTLRFDTPREHLPLHMPFMGHTFSENDKINLQQTGNMGRTVPLKTQAGEYVDSFISVDKVTNRLVAARADRVYINDDYSGVKLSDHEKNELREGRAVYIEGMKSKTGSEFNAHLQVNAERRGVEYIFPKNQKFEYGKKIGGVELSKKQVDAFNNGDVIRVDDMVTKDGRLTSSFIQRDQASGKIQFYKYNPESPEDRREVIIPKEIGGVRTTAEDQKELSEGRPVYMKGMTDRYGEDRSSWVRVDLQTGDVRFAHGADKFDEQVRYEIPQEVFGATISAKQRSELQSGKSVLISGMKGNDGSKFSQWAKVNQTTGKMNYFESNPDAKRDNTQRAAQVPAVNQAREAQKAAKKSKGKSL